MHTTGYGVHSHYYPGQRTLDSVRVLEWMLWSLMQRKQRTNSRDTNVSRAAHMRRSLLWW